MMCNVYQHKRKEEEKKTKERCVHDLRRQIKNENIYIYIFDSIGNLDRIRPLILGLSSRIFPIDVHGEK